MSLLAQVLQKGQKRINQANKMLHPILILNQKNSKIKKQKLRNSPTKKVKNLKVKNRSKILKKEFLQEGKHKANN